MHLKVVSKGGYGTLNVLDINGHHHRPKFSPDIAPSSTPTQPLCGHNREETEVDIIANALCHRKGATLTTESAASDPWVLA